MVLAARISNLESLCGKLLDNKGVLFCPKVQDFWRSKTNRYFSLKCIHRSIMAGTSPHLLSPPSSPLQSLAASRRAHTMKLLTTAALTLLTSHHLHRTTAFTLRKHSSSHVTLKMVETTTNQPDVSSFMNSPRPPETKDYIMQQTMVRVKDPVKSLDFYCNVLGFKLIHYSEVRAWVFFLIILTL